MDRLNKSGWIYLFKSLLSPFLIGFIFFWAAGTTEVPRGWLFLGMSAIHIWASAIILAIYNPVVCNERQDWMKKKDTKKWDLYIVFAYGFLQFYLQTFIMGLDVANGWSYLGLEFVIPGIAMFIASVVLLVWAMTENRFFEVTVRIQKDRNQKVVSSGPYKYVRHPGYIAALLWTCAGPMIVGSVVGLIPGLLAAAILIFRTSLEDKTLHNELKGYKEYAKKVRYRLLPGVW